METIFYNRLSGSQFEKVFLRQRISVLIDVGCCLRQKKRNDFPLLFSTFTTYFPIEQFDYSRIGNVLLYVNGKKAVSLK